MAAMLAGLAGKAGFRPSQTLKITAKSSWAADPEVSLLEKITAKSGCVAGLKVSLPKSSLEADPMRGSLHKTMGHKKRPKRSKSLSKN